MRATSKVLEILTQDDIVRARQIARSFARDMGFNLVAQTKIVTATSELARNTHMHGGGGIVTFTMVSEGGKNGLTLVFHDNGPGIAEIELAMKDGFSTSNGLGLGLGGARRLMNDFDIVSEPGRGTTVTVTMWK